MTAAELEAKYAGCINQDHGLLLLASDDVIRLLDDCAGSEVHFLNMEAFRLYDDGKVEPSMLYSTEAFEEAKRLVYEGRPKGFTWYEVAIRNPITNELLFFKPTC